MTSVEPEMAGEFEKETAGGYDHSVEPSTVRSANRPLAPEQKRVEDDTSGLDSVMLPTVDTDHTLAPVNAFRAVTVPSLAP